MSGAAEKSPSSDQMSGHDDATSATSSRMADVAGQRPSGPKVTSLILQAAQMAESEAGGKAAGSKGKGRAAQFAAAKRGMQGKDKLQQGKGVAAGGKSKGAGDIESAGEKVAEEAKSEPPFFHPAPSISHTPSADDDDFTDASRSSRLGVQKYYRLQGKSYNIPEPPAFALLDMGRQGRKFRLSWNSESKHIAVISVVIFFAAIFSIIGGILFGVLYSPFSEGVEVTVQSVHPKFWSTWQDKSGQLQASSGATSQPMVYLWAEVSIDLQIYNPSKSDAAFYNTSIDMLFQSQEIGQRNYGIFGIIPQGNFTTEVVKWLCDGCPLNGLGQEILQEQKNGTVELIARVYVATKWWDKEDQSLWIEKQVEAKVTVSPHQRS